ncbi:MAG: DUF2520 domain-containing protein [Calditrichota bacterium]|jgi:predicted short-subunit dehydrogenase-like oxidoreductase (DUF2520 family)
MESLKKFSFYIIGGGRAGASLAYYLLRKGHTLISLVERNPERYQFLKDELGWAFVDMKLDMIKMEKTDIFLLTVRDDQIEPLANHLSGMELPWVKKLVIHCSGVLPSSKLSLFKSKGAAVASVHPVYSFSLDPRKNQHFEKVCFSIEGDKPAYDSLHKIFKTDYNLIFPVNETDKQAIHLACVFYANFYVALASQTRQILSFRGWSEKQIFEFLNPLLASAIEQVTKTGCIDALTGPVKRGDIETIKNHLDYLSKNHQELLKYYILMSKQLLKISELSQKDEERLLKKLDQYSSEK